VLTSADHLENTGLSRLGWEEMTPAETDQITSQDKALDTPRPLDGAQGSFVQIDQPNVVLVTWKEAEDGDGTVLRFLEVGGEAGTVNVQTPRLDVTSAWSSDAMERKQSALTNSLHGFSFAVKPYQIVTVRLLGTGNIK
jgi:alpha-mannosidase